MRLFTLLLHEPSKRAPALELLTVRTTVRARELAAKRLRETPMSVRAEVLEGDVALFSITRAELSSEGAPALRS